MKPAIDPGMAALFGGASRAAILGVLANSRVPLTAYRISRLTGAQLTKVSRELLRLERTGLLARSASDRNRPEWALTDPSLRDLLRRRIRIVSAQDWSAEVEARARRARAGPRVRVDLSRFRPTPALVPNPREFLRPRAKDRILVKMGLRPGRRVARGK